MLIKEILDHLSQGELRTLAIGGMDDGGVLRHNYDKVIPHINMGVTEIYKRLPVTNKKLSIQCDLTILEYKLHPRYTQSSGTAPVLYILDTVEEPFLGDVLRIESIRGTVTNNNKGKIFTNNKGEVNRDYLDKTLNDSANTDSISTDLVSFTVPAPTDELIKLEYRAKLPTIDVNTFDINTSEIDLPYAYLSALLNYVGMRMTTGMPAKEGISDSNTFLGRFEACIAKIEELGLVVSNDTTNYKATNNGWV